MVISEKLQFDLITSERTELEVLLENVERCNTIDKMDLIKTNENMADTPFVCNSDVKSVNVEASNYVELVDITNDYSMDTVNYNFVP